MAQNVIISNDLYNPPAGLTQTTNSSGGTSYKDGSNNYYTQTAPGQYTLSNPTGTPVSTVATSSIPASTPALPPPTQLSNPTPTPTAGTVSTPTLPTPTAPATNQSYQNSLQQQLIDSQAALKAQQDKYQAQLDAQQKQAQTDYENARSGQATALNQQGDLTLQEKQDKLAQLQIEQQRFDTNYSNVQGLVGQLQDLMTQGNELIKQQKDAGGLASIQNVKLTQTQADINGKAAVIKAGIDIYNGQMNQAQNQLKTATDVITSAYSDQLNYYKTLDSFYESQAKDSNSKLISISSDQKAFMTDKINELEAQVKQVQANSDMIQKAMVDPTTAQAYAQAGVSLTDTPEQINSKLGTYYYSKELSTLSNTMAEKGYEALGPGQKAPAGSQTVTTTDSKGVVKQWYSKPTKVTSATGSGALTKAQYDKLSIAGVATGLADAITAEILQGTSLDDIRATLRKNNQDPQILDRYDNVVGINNLFKNQ